MRGLIVGDYHAHPEYDNKRATVLGKAICDLRPDLVAFTGDFGDMPSLSSYDKGKGSFEGRRFTKDIKAIRDALDKVYAQLTVYNLRRRANRLKAYKPRVIITRGNHEYRCNRAANDAPELQGLLDDALPFKEYGIEDYEYKVPVTINGWTFVHEHSGARGKTPARGLALAAGTSVVIGHLHRRDEHTMVKLNGERTRAIVAGCYIHPEYDEPWCRAFKKDWERGIFMVDDMKDGDYGALTWMTTETLRDRYGAS